MKKKDLPENLQKEFYSRRDYNYRLTKEEFEKLYDNVEIEEFINMPNTAYNEWTNWKRRTGNAYTQTSISKLWNDFKVYYQYDTKETQTVFKELSKLSENLLNEWELKCYDKYPYNKDDSKKTKAVLWKEFKEIWEIDIENYNENKYNEIEKFVSKNEFETKEFYEYLTDSNFHSYGSYSILEQYEICQDYLVNF